MPPAFSTSARRRGAAAAAASALVLLLCLSPPIAAPAEALKLFGDRGIAGYHFKKARGGAVLLSFLSEQISARSRDLIQPAAA